MAKYRILAVMVQPVAIEEDDAGNVVNQHTLQGEVIYHPYGLNCEEVVKRKLAEFNRQQEKQP